jgi:hypothetical protein
MTHHLLNRLVVLSAAAVAVLTGAMLAPPAEAQPLFPNPVYPVGSFPTDLAQADFDGDGLADLMVANATLYYYDPGVTGELSLLHGRGDGSFDEEVRIPLSRPARTVLAADYDRDGHADLVVGFWEAAAFLPGLGDGTFGAEVPITAAGPIWSISQAEFNGDAQPDLFVGGILGGYAFFQALLGRGDGTFAAAPALRPSEPIAATARADLNGDGRDDMLLTRDQFRSCDVPVPPVSQVNETRVLLGNGDGTFVQAGSFTTGEWTAWIVPADLDADGRIDLVVNDQVYAGCSGTGNRIIHYYGNGDGTFTATDPIQGRLASIAIITTDLNGDGMGDYLENDGNALTAYLGHGDRTFTALPSLEVSRDTYSVHLGDYDQDGRRDLSALSSWAEAVFVFAGNGDGTFGPPPIPALQATGLNGAVSEDLNGDGIIDLVATGYRTEEVVVLLGQGGGAFGAETRFPVGVGPSTIVIADFDADGRKDLAVGLQNWHTYPPERFPDGSLAILIGNGDGTFQPPAIYDGGQNPIAIVVSDFNGDGAPDVAQANWGGGTYGPVGDLSIFLNNGDGTMAPQARMPVGARIDPYYDTTTPATLAVGDFDRDGHRDLVVGMRGTWNSPQLGEVEILFGDGQGAFSAPVAVLQLWLAESVAVGDLNRDGFDDIAVADPAVGLGYAPGGLYILLGNGDGTFVASDLLPAGVGPIDVKIDDFNADAIPDLAVWNNGGYLALLPGNGDGTYGPRLNFGLFGVPLAIAKGDFDGDGRPDLMVISTSGAFVYLNAAVPSLAIDASVAFGSPLGKGSATVTWTTNGEWDLRGFNIYVIDNRGRRQINDVIVPCGECLTGLGSTYTFYLPKHKSARNLYVEAVHRSGRKELFGPARRE